MIQRRIDMGSEQMDRIFDVQLDCRNMGGILIIRNKRALGVIPNAWIVSMNCDGVTPAATGSGNAMTTTIESYNLDCHANENSCQTFKEQACADSR